MTRYVLLAERYLMKTIKLKTMETFQEKLATIEEVDNKMQELAKEGPNTEYTIIFSNDFYFIEDGIPFVRSWEKRIWSGKAKNWKLNTDLK
jgi:hypothetical protein